MANKDDGRDKGERLCRVRHLMCPQCKGNDVALYEPEHTCICQTCHQWFPAPPVLPCPDAEQWPTAVKPPTEFMRHQDWTPRKNLAQTSCTFETVWWPTENTEAALKDMVVTLEDSTGLKTHFKFDRTELDGQEFRLVFKLDRIEGLPDPPDNLHTITITPKTVEPIPIYGVDVPAAKPVFFDCSAVRPDAVASPGKKRPSLVKENCPRCGRYVDANDKLQDGRICCRNCARICTAEDLITDEDDYEWVV